MNNMMHTPETTLSQKARTSQKSILYRGAIRSGITFANQERGDASLRTEPSGSVRKGEKPCPVFFSESTLF